MNKFKSCFPILGLFISSLVFSQHISAGIISPIADQQTLVKDITAEKALLSPKEQIDFNINKMFSDPVLRNASWGFVVYDPKTGEIVTSYNENTPLVPASTTKLLTTETAFSLVGTNFRWNTQLEYSGSIDRDGVLDGNLYIVGSGDPTLGGNRGGASSYGQIVVQYLESLKEIGIKKINGDIVVQTAIFKENKSNLPQNIVWIDQPTYYLPAGSTKDINPKNEKSLAKQSPKSFKDAKKYFYISPYTNEMVFTNEFNGESVGTKVADPPVYLANKLREALIKNKIIISGKVTPKIVDKNPESRQTINVYKSPTLSEVTYFTNQKSDNRYSEEILKFNGFMKLGDQTIDSGRMVVMSHLKDLNFDVEGFSYIDGSGLSRAHKVTPISQVKYLTTLMDQPYYKEFVDTLPIAGQTGTLRNMFLVNSNGQIFAKTGTLNHVKCLAGYIKTRKNKTLAFSLLINNYAGSPAQVKARMEQLLDPTLDL